MPDIRIAHLQDLPVIRYVAAHVWFRTYRFVISQDQMDYMFAHMYSAQALENQMEQGHTFLLAYQNDMAVGFASYKLEGDTMKVPKLYVRTDRHKTGTGTALLDFIKQEGQSKRLRLLLLNVNRFNPAVGFYLRYGMHIDEIVDIPYHNFVLNDYVMALEI